MMKPSYYNIFLEDFPEKDCDLVFNTRTQAFAVIENQLSAILKLYRGKDVKLEKEDYQTLIENGFCVESHQDEESIIKKWLNEVSETSKKLSITLLTTYRCNFDCPYCFEKNCDKNKMDMDESTADSVIKWIQFKVLQKNIKDIDLFFYGGEPFLNKKIIYYIAEKVNNLTKLIQFKFNFGVVTNGYLINPEDTLKLKKLGLDHYRITLDGTEQYHDSSRYLKSGKGTFQTIMRNIKNHPGSVKIIIGGNYTDRNYEGILDLIEYLGNHYIRNKIFSMNFSPVDNIIGGASFFDTASGCMNYNTIDKKVVEINKKIKEYGFTNPRTKIGMQTCPFKLKDASLTISPEGDIYKCPTTVGQKEYCVGHVREAELNEKNVEFYSNDNWHQCIACEYLPMCQGGCYYQSIIKSGDIHELDCPKNYFDSIVPRSLREEYEDMA